MACNLSVSESLLLQGALAFSACTCFVDPCHLDVFGDTGEVACLQLEALRQAVVGFAAGWQLASVRQYAVAGLSSCPFGFSSRDGLDDLSCLQAGC